MPQFVVCVEAAGATASVSPCSDADGVFFHPVVMEFPAPGAVHFQNADQLFAYGFTGVLTIWLLGIGVGLILSLIRRGQ